jgi:hypothetical protein
MSASQNESFDSNCGDDDGDSNPDPNNPAKDRREKVGNSRNNELRGGDKSQ